MWQKLHEALLAQLNAAGEIDWRRAAVDSSHVRAFGGANARPEPSGPPKARFQAPPDHLWAGKPAGLGDNCGQRQRRDPFRAAGGRRAADRGTARSAKAKTEERLRRSGLPLAEIPPRTAPPQDQGQGRQARRPARFGPRSKALGGRAHHLLASPVPPSTGALRASRRYPRGIPDDRLLPDLLQAAPGGGIILKGALRGSPLSVSGQPLSTDGSDKPNAETTFAKGITAKQIGEDEATEAQEAEAERGRREIGEGP